MSLRLTLVETGWTTVLQHSVVIGRDRGCDLRIDDARIGARHAEVYSIGTLWWVRDLGSDDGTFLNGEIIEAEPLKPPCEIRLGTHGPRLRLEASGTAREVGRRPCEETCSSLPAVRRIGRQSM